MGSADISSNTTTSTVLSTSDADDSAGYVSFIVNTVATKEVWKRVYGEFRGLYSRKAFLSCYMSEDMDEGEVVEAQNSLCELIAEYELQSGVVL